MVSTRRSVLGAVATVSIAGCLGGDGDDENGGASPGTDDGVDSPTNSPTAMATESPTETATPTDSDGNTSAIVGVSSHDELGEILVGPDGLTLYTFDPDTQGEGASACSGDCADAWPPLTVEDSPTAGSNVNDEEPGDANGQGVNDVWWVLDPAGEPVRSS